MKKKKPDPIITDPILGTVTLTPLTFAFIQNVADLRKVQKRDAEKGVRSIKLVEFEDMVDRHLLAMGVKPK